MKKFGIVIFGAQLLLLPAAGFGQARIGKATKFEIGAAFGTPAIVQPVLALHFREKFGIRLSGMILPDIRGIQGSAFLTIRDTKKLQWDMETHIGALTTSVDLPSLVVVDRLISSGEFRVVDDHWIYIGLGSAVNFHGFFLSAGLSLGTGTYNNPQVLLQLGYVRRFRR